MFLQQRRRSLKNAGAAFALCGLLWLCRPAFGQTDSFVIEDIFGRTLNSRGIVLVDWEGHLANPAIQLFLRPPFDAVFPLQIALSANGARLYFDLPSTWCAAGPAKSIAFESVSSKKSFLISIFPDRDTLPEDYILTIAWSGGGGTQRTQNVDIHVIDQDKDQALLFDILIDFSQDKTGFFGDPAKRDIVTQAAKDWAYFIGDMSLDTVEQAAETTWIWNQDGFKSGYYVTNNSSYNGFLLFVYGIHHDQLRSGGEPSAGGGFQTSAGRELPLKRSGGVEVEIQGNYNALGWFLTSGDDDWWFSRNLSGEPNDLYSIVRHEMGHALFFETHYPKFASFKADGAVRDEAVYAYQGSFPKIDSHDHFSGEVDRASGKGMFGNEYHGTYGVGMPLGRWIITKLDLLCAQAIGYRLRATTAFVSAFIKDEKLPQGRIGEPFSGWLQAEGGIPSYFWSLESGDLPDGLNLDSFTGEISGTPARGGISYFNVRLRDNDESNPGVSRAKSLTVNPRTDEMLLVLSPNGGEVWDGGSRQTILWESQGSIAAVRIDYTTDAGKTYKSIAPSAPNTGSFVWVTPIESMKTCFVRIADAGGDVMDASDSAFGISERLLPPIHFQGERHENRSLLQREFVNFLRWEPPPGPRGIVFKYRIYIVEGSTRNLLAELGANSGEYLHRKVEKDKTYTYALVSVDSENRESQAVTLTIR